MSHAPSKNLGVVHLIKTHKHKRNPKSAKKTNFVRERLTKEDKKQLKFSQFEPIYDLWKAYFSDLTRGNFTNLDERMLRADYHGALLQVAAADNKTMIGITGIVVLETKHTMQLITPEDRYVVLPKSGTTFQFVFASHVFTLFAGAIEQRAALRGKKMRNTVALPYLLR